MMSSSGATSAPNVHEDEGGRLLDEEERQGLPPNFEQQMQEMVAAAVRSEMNSQENNNRLRELVADTLQLSSVRSATVVSRGQIREVEFAVPRDTFSLMMFYDITSLAYFVSFSAFAMQILLVTLIIIIQIRESERSTIFNVPISVDIEVRIGQFLVVPLCLWYQSDVLTSVQTFLAFWNLDPADLRTVFNHEGDIGCGFWLWNIILPNLFKFFQGIIVLAITLIVIIQGDSLIELLKDFTALLFVSDIDNIIFTATQRGYFGQDLAREADKVAQMTISDKSRWSFMLRTVLISCIGGAMLGVLYLVVDGQDSGRFTRFKYPDCNVDFKSSIGDGICHGGDYNTYKCGWDDGDCFEHNSQYPLCRVDNAFLIGDGTCNGGEINTIQCGWEDRDCDMQNEALWKTYPECNGGVQPSTIGDNICDGGPNYTPECGWDGGDCGTFEALPPDCSVDKPSNLGNVICNGGVFNTEACEWDKGDCDDENKILWITYPECKGGVKPSTIGDSICDGGPANTEECGFDGGDCKDFNNKYENCTVDHPSYVGKGTCNGGVYNTPQCGMDGGDCAEFNSRYPKCKVEIPPLIGDGKCDPWPYSTKECGYDGGDCTSP